MIKRVSTALTWSAQVTRAGGSHVMIDVLRASSTIATALANGAAEIIPALEPSDALGIADELGRDRVLLAGERDALPPEGFDLGNSPSAFTRDVVEGKTIVFATTNGTRILRALPQAGAAFVGCLLNAAALARALDGGAGEEALLVCAGQAGAFGLEDFVGAGAIVTRLARFAPGALTMDDASAAAAQLYLARRADIMSLVASSEHARALRALGLVADIEYCCRVDDLDVAPVLRGRAITA